MREAALKVLPAWIIDNPEHSDAVEARDYLESDRGYFGIPRKEVAA